MIDKNYYEDYKITSEFGKDRSSWTKIKNYKFHVGVDGVGDKLIKNLFLGTIKKIYTEHKIYGNAVEIMHNAKYSKGVDSLFYTRYCHLKEISRHIKEGDKIEAGRVLGIMGNTGYSFGDHIHFECKQRDVETGEYTKLLKDMINKIDMTLDEKSFFWQTWSKKVGKKTYKSKILYINPFLVYKYLKEVL
jgi:murein DD-endopeptidase MepM/ murein hydrolase activator NlpD